MFYVGQRVVCVDDSPASDGCHVELKLGSVYTVSEAHWCDIYDWGVLVIEAPRPPERPYFSPFYKGQRFRPVVERKTDISIFKAMLNPSKQGADA